MPVVNVSTSVWYRLLQGRIWVGVLTSSSQVGQVHVSLVAQVRQHDGADDIAHHSLLSVIFTPVDVRAAGLASAVDDTSGLEVVEDSLHGWQILHASCGAEDNLALTLEQRVQMAADPAIAAGKEEAVVGRHLGSNCRVKRLEKREGFQRWQRELARRIECRTECEWIRRGKLMGLEVDRWLAQCSDGEHEFGME